MQSLCQIGRTAKTDWFEGRFQPYWSLVAVQVSFIFSSFPSRFWNTAVHQDSLYASYSSELM
jgi:hypothetical protein